MQGIQDWHVEVERCDVSVGILGCGSDREDEFEFVNLCRFDNSWFPWAVGRVCLRIGWTCNLHDCVVRFGFVRVALRAASSKHVGLSHLLLVLPRCVLQIIKGSHVVVSEMTQQISRASGTHINHGLFLRPGATR